MMIELIVVSVYSLVTYGYGVALAAEAWPETRREKALLMFGALVWPMSFGMYICKNKP